MNPTRHLRRGAAVLLLVAGLYAPGDLGPRDAWSPLAKWAGDEADRTDAWCLFTAWLRTTDRWRGEGDRRVYDLGSYEVHYQRARGVPFPHPRDPFGVKP